MYPYQDKTLSPEIRARDLVSRMSLAEKAAQTCMLRGVEYATKPSPKHDCSVDADTDFNFEKLLADFGTDGFGFVHDTYATPAAFNKLQRHFVESSRWGIPVIFTGEALHGISGLRGTVFPVPLNWGASFDPELVERCCDRFLFLKNGKVECEGSWTKENIDRIRNYFGELAHTR